MGDVDRFHDLRILVVQRDPQTRRRITDYLRDAGCARIKTLEDAHSAIEALTTGPFEGVITEVNPNPRSWGLVRLIRCGRFCEPTLPIVAMVDDLSTQAVDVEAGEHGVAVLPVGELARLVDTVKGVLNGHRKPRVLVIEDDPRMAQFIEQSLHDLYRVELTYTGEAGLTAWKARHHELVLLDVMLPDLTGGEVLVQILTADKAQLVIILTAYGTHARHVDLILKGATEFLQKPVRVKILRAACNTVLRQRQSQALSTEIARSEATLNYLSHCTEAADEALTSGQALRASLAIKQGLLACRKRSVTDDTDGSDE